MPRRRSTSARVVEHDRGVLDRHFADRYQELRRIAAGLKRNDPGVTINPTALVNEAWLRLSGASTLGALSVTHFKALAARAMRRVLIDEARRCMSQPSVTLAGRLAMPELAALIGDARLLLSNNTGPAHIAAAMGTPVTVLYALTNPQHTPWRVPAQVLSHDVPCRHCLKSECPQGHHDCLMKVQPDDVVRAAAQLLRHQPRDVPVNRTGARQPEFDTQGSTA